jgi:hypothetical protein
MELTNQAMVNSPYLLDEATTGLTFLCTQADAGVAAPGGLV